MLKTRLIVTSLACISAFACAEAVAAGRTGQAIDADVGLEALRLSRETEGKVHAGLLALKRQSQITAAPGVRPSRTGLVAKGLTLSGPRTRSGRVLVDAFANGDPASLQVQLTAAGATQVQTHGQVVSAWVRVEDIDRLADLSAASHVRPSPGFGVAAGRVTTQGDAGQQSDVARFALGVNGAGTEVGILSDSWNSLGTAAAGVRAGELPGPGNPEGFTTPVRILKDVFDGSDEGRAMGEIVHDVAPGARLAFYGPETYLDHADGIRRLAAAGSTVVVDDIYWYGEPWFQDNPIGRAARDVGQQYNTTVLTIAGNFNRDSLEARFTAAPTKDLLLDGSSFGRYKLHRFPNGQVTVPVTLKNGSSIGFVLQWDEPFASASTTGRGAASDLDLFIFGESQGVNITFGSVARNLGNDAQEQIFLNLNDPDDANATATVYLGVGAREGISGTPKNFKIVAYDVEVPTDIPRTTLFNKATIVGHSNEASLITACAVRYDRINNGVDAVPETFSSVGGFLQTIDAAGFPRPPLDTRKPDLCSPDGGNTSFFGFDYDGDSDALPNFFGTSAAAPHAAGIAALVQQASRGRAKPAQIKQILIESSLDMNDPATPGRDPGYDTKTGAGFLRAPPAVARGLVAR